ncbi:MAG: DUF4397 domain-containing protein [Lachnospiraceae bacterium]|nr:DUF4397 domain-containing protein [Lachnospiraceae bacterium]
MKQFKRFYVLEEIGSPAFTVPYADVPSTPQTSEDEELIFIPEIDKTQIQIQYTVPNIPSVNIPAKDIGEPEYLYQPVKPSALYYIRFLHAAPLTQAIDIYVNDVLMSKNVKYGDFTEYYPLSEDLYEIKIYEHMEKSVPILSLTQNIGTDSISTLAFIGAPETLELYPIKDFGQKASSETRGMRFIHLLPDMGNIDIYIDDIKIISDMAYKDVSNYALLPLEKQSIVIKNAGTDNVLFKMYNFLKSGYYYTVYIIGHYASTELPQIFFKI